MTGECGKPQGVLFSSGEIPNFPMESHAPAAVCEFPRVVHHSEMNGF